MPNYRCYVTQDRGEQNYPWWEKGVANVLFLSGKSDESKAKYRSLLDKINAKEGHWSLSSLRGWCCFRLTDYDQALQLLTDALSLIPNLDFALFDRALVLICSGAHELGVRAYARSVAALQSKNKRRQRGLLRVALNDLQQTATRIGFLTQAKAIKEAEQILKKGIAEVELALNKSTKLPKETRNGPRNHGHKRAIRVL